MPSHERVRLINTILKLYYVERVTRTEIADRLDLSTPKVNRLIQQARELGYISFVIRTPYQQLFDLEARLKAVFGLQEAIVIPTSGNTSICSRFLDKSVAMCSPINSGRLVSRIGTVAAALSVLEHFDESFRKIH